jgi:hypothetical protein
MPPLRLMNWSSGSEWHLYASAYRSTRDHLDRVWYMVLDRLFQPGRRQPKIGVHSFEICLFQAIFPSRFRLPHRIAALFGKPAVFDDAGRR